nr:biotin-independent malonate decarboxylase subunit gamma [uncultured Cupriavidus sp.]
MSANHEPQTPGRGEAWLAALSGNAPRLSGYPQSIQVADIETGGRAARLIAVVPDAASPFPRARHGEVGLLEGWSLARAVHEAIAADRDAPVKRAIIAIVDTPSQAYGRREEAFGIHQALASAAAAYATARLQGHPVIALLVGKAMSGAFLAHGYQANRILALADPGVQVHAMGKEAAARITLRSVEDLEAFAATVPPMAYDIGNYATLGLLWRTIPVRDAAMPGAEDLDTVTRHLAEALADIDADPQRDLRSRQQGENRGATRRVRERLASQWHE